MAIPQLDPPPLEVPVRTMKSPVTVGHRALQRSRRRHRLTPINKPTISVRDGVLQHGALSPELFNDEEGWLRDEPPRPRRLWGSGWTWPAICLETASMTQPPSPATIGISKCTISSKMSVS